MVPIRAILGLFLIINFTHGKELKDENEIVWPEQYYFKGETLDFQTDINEPFELWYHAESNRFAISLYGGTIKNIYDADSNHCYSFHPWTTDEDLNEAGCTRKRCQNEKTHFLPEVAGLEHTGNSTTLYEREVDIWTSTEEYGDESMFIMKRTVHLYKTEYGYDIPVKEIKKAYHKILGNILEHTVTDFYKFDPNVTEDDVALPLDEEYCVWPINHVKDLEADQNNLQLNVPGEVDNAFNNYMNKHNKKYHEEEVITRKQIFEKNWRMVEEHNRKNLSFRMQVNAFSDRTPEELKQLTGRAAPKPRVKAQQFPHTVEEIEYLAEKLPKRFDLRLQGYVTPVKNQGTYCASGWAFATAAAVETTVAKSNGARLLHLSEQSLIDCSWGYDNDGCDGGHVGGAMKYIVNYGIPTEQDYGFYIANNGYCNISNEMSVTLIGGFAQVTPRYPNAMKVALVKYGAVAATLQADINMHLYYNGIFYDVDSVQSKENYLNHAVTVVGYGVRDGDDYWLVKNSWGETWGEGGYMLISAKDNNCFILDDAYYPIV